MVLPKTSSTRSTPSPSAEAQPPPISLRRVHGHHHVNPSPGATAARDALPSFSSLLADGSVPPHKPHRQLRPSFSVLSHHRHHLNGAGTNPVPPPRSRVGPGRDSISYMASSSGSNTENDALGLDSDTQDDDDMNDLAALLAKRDQASTSVSAAKVHHRPHQFASPTTIRDHWRTFLSATAAAGSTLAASAAVPSNSPFSDRLSLGARVVEAPNALLPSSPPPHRSPSPTPSPSTPSVDDPSQPERSPELAVDHAGRANHVLIERRSNPTPFFSSWNPRGLNLELPSLSSHSSPSSNQRRSSPATLRSPSTAGPRPQSRPPRKNTAKRSPSPEPLTLDSINSSSFNPFPLVQRHLHFRTELVPEVALLTCALAFALYRLSSMSPALVPVVSSIPLSSLCSIAAAVPVISLFRSRSSYLKVPFTDERGYRPSSAADDGVAVALTLPILLASACLWDTYSSLASSTHDTLSVGLPGARSLVDLWESAGVKAVPPPALRPTMLDSARALIAARTQLVNLTALNALMLILHLTLAKTALRIEKVPTGNTKRFFGFYLLACSLSGLVYLVFLFYARTIAPLPISPLEAGITTFIQQSAFYLVSRLARRAFTLGELITMTSAGNALSLEFWKLTRSRWLYKRGQPYIPPTFRTPTALLVYQTVLIPGAFLCGTLLSPLLVISRHIAQKPSHRLRWPTERERQRRLLAIGVLLGLFGIVFFMLGGWAGWQLGPRGGLRTPWLWVLAFVLTGTDAVNDSKSPFPTRWNRYKRLVLVVYWIATISVAVGGWQTKFARARKYKKMSTTTSTSSTSSSSSLSNTSTTHIAGDHQSTIKPSSVTKEERRIVHSSLNMRRKFFHVLAVLMFVPGIAIDPVFTSLAFSVAFALFTFFEYARYFALHPVGAPLHIFFSEFVDDKDSGPVILSHFYLLSGCAGGLWLEGRGVNSFSGVLVLGVGDSMASIVGKLVGRHRWFSSPKTVEGTLAFVLSVLLSAWFLRLTGLTPHFSMPKYTVATTLAALLEACSMQNDNLVIPIYMWSLVALLEC